MANVNTAALDYRSLTLPSVGDLVRRVRIPKPPKLKKWTWFLLFFNITFVIYNLFDFSIGNDSVAIFFAVAHACFTRAIYLQDFYVNQRQFGSHAAALKFVFIGVVCVVTAIPVSITT